jgi:hypothetical protein
VDRPEAGRFLKDRFFAPGSSLSWDEHLASVTGRRLDPSAFLRDLGLANGAAATS